MNGAKPTFLILDGQQRLTSLYQAFFGVGEHRYYIKLNDLLDGADFEEAIFHLRAAHKRARRLEQFDVQATGLILPLNVLKDGAGGFSQWTLDVAQASANKGSGEVRETLARIQALGGIHKTWIQVIDDYRFPVVTLSDETDAAAICTIFETLNRTGMKLSAFELLTARFWPHDTNLRQLWDQAREAWPIIADFEIDPYYVVQAIALVARRTPSCKRSDVLNLTPEHIQEWWDRTVAGLRTALEILRDDCGVIVPKWLPYNTIVIPFTAVLTKHPLPGGPEAGGIRNKLVRWYWCSVFGQAYENSANSQSAKDVSELWAWLEDDQAVPETVATVRFDPRILRDTTARQRALYRGTIGLVLRDGPRDFHNGKPITGDLIVEHHIDDHHIFPDSHLKKAQVSTRLRDCVLNRTLIDRKTNIRISDRAPSDYMKEIRAATGPEIFEQLLDSHRIAGDDLSPIWRDDFEAFLDQRQAALWEQIKEVTGILEAADLMVEETT